MGRWGLGSSEARLASDGEPASGGVLAAIAAVIPLLLCSALVQRGARHLVDSIRGCSQDDVVCSLARTNGSTAESVQGASGDARETGAVAVSLPSVLQPNLSLVRLLAEFKHII